MKANEANKVRDLKRLEQKTYDYESQLSASLEELAKAVSLVLGYEVVADFCHGNEIEFRVYGDNGVPDTDSCIRMEEVIAKIK